MADAKGAPDLARQRAAAQLLGPPKRRSPVQIVRHLLAVQAQEFASVPLALRARSNGLKRSQVHAALDSGELIISWLNRGTLHLVCREDYWWLHALTAPTMRTASTRRLAQEGVTHPQAKLRALAKMLAEGPLLKREIRDRIGLQAQALTHLLLAATLDGLVVRGPIQGREQTFVLARDWIGEPPSIDREAALAELAKRYLAGHAPSTRADLAYWAKLPLRDVPQLEGLTDLNSGDAPVPAKLLPAFDPYIMGWKERSFAIPETLAGRVIPGGGMFRAVVLIDGRVAGTWSRAGGRVVIEAPRPITGLDAEIADVERFLRA